MNHGMKAVFAAVMGVLYIGFGILEIVSWIFPGLAAMDIIPADVLGGLVLCVIGLVFLSGVPGLRSGTPMATAFLYVGLLLSLAFGLVAFLSIGAGWLETALFGDWMEVSGAELAVPMIYLALLSLIGYAAWGREFFQGIARA